MAIREVNFFNKEEPFTFQDFDSVEVQAQHIQHRNDLHALIREIASQRADGSENSPALQGVGSVETTHINKSHKITEHYNSLLKSVLGENDQTEGVNNFSLIELALSHFELAKSFETVNTQGKVAPLLE